MTCLIHSYKLQRKWGQHIELNWKKINIYLRLLLLLLLIDFVCLCEKNEELKIVFVYYNMKRLDKVREKRIESLFFVVAVVLIQYFQ